MPRHDYLTHAEVTLRIPRAEVATVAGLLREAYGSGPATLASIRRWEAIEDTVRRLGRANDDTDRAPARPSRSTAHRAECHLYGTGERHAEYAPCNPTGGA